MSSAAYSLVMACTLQGAGELAQGLQ